MIEDYGSDKCAKHLQSRYFSIKPPAGGEQFFNSTFDALIKDTMKKILEGESYSSMARKGDFNAIAAAVQAWKGKTQNVSSILNDAAEEISLIDGFMTMIDENALAIALENPQWAQLLGIQLEGDMIIQLSQSMTSKAASQLNSAQKAAEKDNLKEVSKALPIAAGWFFEAEFLIGALKAIKEGNYAFSVIPTTISSGTRDAIIKASNKIEEDANKCDELIAQIKNTLISQGISSEKADIFFGDGSFYFGITLKNTNENKAFAGKASTGSRKRAVSLSTTSKSFVNALKDRTLNNVVGGRALWTVIQSAFSLKKTKSSSPRANIRNIMDISASLLLADALVGALKDFTAPGYVSYLVVNGHVYRTPEVLRAAITAIKNSGKSGATVNDRQIDSLMSEGKALALKRASDFNEPQEGSKFILNNAESTIQSKIGNVKIGINLKYLMSKNGGNLVEIG